MYMHIQVGIMYKSEAMRILWDRSTSVTLCHDSDQDAMRQKAALILKSQLDSGFI